MAPRKSDKKMAKEKHMEQRTAWELEQRSGRIPTFAATIQALTAGLSQFH